MRGGRDLRLGRSRRKSFAISDFYYRPEERIGRYTTLGANVEKRETNQTNALELTYAIRKHILVVTGIYGRIYGANGAARKIFHS